MTVFARIKQSATLAVLAMAFSNTAQAGSGTGVVLGPPGGGPGGPGGGAEAIPTMGTTAMIAMGLLLAVVALRFLQQKGIAQKVLSVAFLGSGLVVAGLGVDKATATTTAGVPAESSLCSGGSGFVSDLRSGNGGGQLQNNCASTTLQVISYRLNCPANVQIVTDAGVGAQIAPGQTVTMNACPPT